MRIDFYISILSESEFSIEKHVKKSRIFICVTVCQGQGHELQLLGLCMLICLLSVVHVNYASLSLCFR